VSSKIGGYTKAESGLTPCTVCTMLPSVQTAISKLFVRLAFSSPTKILLKQLTESAWRLWDNRPVY